MHEAASRGLLGHDSTHCPVLAGWAMPALTAAGFAHHTGQRGEAAANRTTCYYVSFKWGRAERPVATIQSHTSAVSSDTAAAKLQGGHTTGDRTRQPKTGSEFEGPRVQ